MIELQALVDRIGLTETVGMAQWRPFSMDFTYAGRQVLCGSDSLQAHYHPSILWKQTTICNPHVWKHGAPVRER